MKRVMALTAVLLLVPLLVRLLVAQPSPAPQSPSAPPPSPTYTLTDLGPLAITAVPGGATALNASGQVTGFRFENFNPAVCLASGANRAFLWNNGYTELGTLTPPGASSPGASSFGYGINSAGQIAGGADICVNTRTSVQRAFVWQNGVMTALDPSTNTNLTSAALAINSNGDIAGYMNNGGYLPAIWKAATIAPSPSGAVRSNNVVTITTTSANNFVVGNAVAIAGVSDPSFDGSFTIVSLPSATSFTYSQAGTGATAGSGTTWGQVMLANLPGSTQGQARAINDLGQTVGSAQPPGAMHAVMWDTNGQIKDLGTLPGTFSASNQANAINNNGAVAGYSQIDGATIHACVWRNGTMTDLGTIPGANPANNNLTDTNSAAWGINSKGDMVGISGYGTSAAIFASGGRAFLYTGGQMYDLLTLLAPGTGWRQLEAAWAINDNGQIVGVGIDANQQEHGFLLTPITTPTTTAVASSVNPSVFGQQVSFTATVTPTQSSALTPTGNVTFNDGATVLGTAVLSSGTATFTTTALGVGSHAIIVSYAGDNNFSSSTSAALTQMVSQATTTTTLSASPNPSNLGQTVTLTATVTVVAPAAGTPSGTVTFVDGTTTLGIGLLNGAGNVTFATSSLSAGNHSITATYGGDANFSGSTTASSVTVTVQGPPPPVQITDNETITVTDTESFPDVFDAESVKVTDQVTVHAFFPLAINPAPPVLSAVQGQPYSGVTFSGTGGYQAVMLSESGAVPGMTFTISGASASFSGTPTQAGTFPFTVTATDSIGNVLNQTYSLLVAATCPAISVAPSGPLGPVTAGSVFSQRFTATGGIGNVIWSESGPLPNGLTFSTFAALFGNLGALSGVPSQSGTFAVTVTATDQNGCQGSSNVSLLVVPPPAVITDNETIHVTDTASFPDVFDPEQIHVTDQIAVIPCDFTLTANSSPINVPVGGSGSTPITVTSVNGCNLQVSLTPSTSRLGVSASLSSPSVTPPSGGSSTSTLTVSVGPSITPTSFALTITGSAGLTHSVSVSVSVAASISGTTGVVQNILNAGGIDSVGVANALTSKLSAAQAAPNAQTSINTLKAFQNQVQAQAGKHIATSATISGVTFNPASTLMNDGQGLIDTLRTGMIPDPITGYVVDANGVGLAGATVSIIDANGNTVATATTDVTGFYFMATTGVLTPGATYTLQVTGFPAGFANSTPANQQFTWQGSAVALSNFVLN